MSPCSKKINFSPTRQGTRVLRGHTLITLANEGTYLFQMICLEKWYSSVPNAHLLILRKNSPLHGLILVCTFIDFEKNFPPARLFFCIYNGICPARLLILRKKSPLHGLILVCMFIVFERKFPLHIYFPAFLLLFALHVY